jgi:TolA-binding protein
MVELQRDVFLLQDQVKALEKSQGDRLAAIEQKLTSALANQEKITAALTALDRRMTEQAKTVNTPVATVASKVDGMSAEITGVQSSLAEINATLRRMQGQMADVSNAIKVLQAPPAAPPDANSPPAGMTSDSLYQSALRARSSGQYDLALQQFNDYLRFFPTTDLATNAQFYVGDLQHSLGQAEEALRSFDAVIEKYPENKRTLDAMYMKGVVLAKSDPKAAGNEFRVLIKKAPNSEQADKARDQLRRLSAAPPARKK